MKDVALQKATAWGLTEMQLAVLPTSRFVLSQLALSELNISES